jgi:ABC-2 type transport system permease protein
MRLWSVFRKSLREQLRELWLVFLVIALGPFFVILFSLVFGGGAWVSKIIVVNHDRGRDGAGAIAALEHLRSSTGAPAFKVFREAEVGRAERMLVKGTAHALLVIPPDFSASLDAARAGRTTPRSTVIYSGDLANMNYMVAVVQALNCVAAYVGEAIGNPGPFDMVERPLGGTGGKSDLDLALPGLFVFSLILLIFPTAMALARENDTGSLRRLQLTRMTAFDLLGGLSMVQVLIGAAAVLLTFGTAYALGFRSQGPLWVAMVVSVIASFSIIGVGLLTACFSRSVTEAFILGNFPMMLLMFFSGAMLPIPKVVVCTIGGVSVGLWDWLPTTHAVSVMNKVLGIGVGLDQVVYEIVMLTLLSGLYFAAGVWLFKRRRMVAA